jgi:predicted MFS family arabinose efflux permease
VLRHRDFRLLWLSQSISLVGDRIVTVALALYVTQETGSASDLGLVLASYSAPLVALLLIGGVWADRLPRQRVMIAADLLRFGLHGSLAVLILRGDAPIGAVMAIEAAAGASAAFFQPAYTGLVPQTVPEEDIQSANALTAGSSNLAELVGPALATALVLGLGAGAAFLVDASSFLVSASLLLFVRPRPRGEPAPREPILRELAAGWREVRSRPWVWVTIASFSFALFTALAPFYVLGALIADDNWGSTGWYGLVSALLGAGTVAGAIAGFRLRPRHPMRSAMIATLAWPVALLSYALGAPLPIVCVAFAIAGLGLALFDVWWLTALAQRIPPNALGRVSSFDWMGSLGLLPLGYVVAGALASAFGATKVAAVGAVAGAVALAIALCSRDLRDLEAIELVRDARGRERDA